MRATLGLLVRQEGWGGSGWVGWGGVGLFPEVPRSEQLPED